MGPLWALLAALTLPPTSPDPAAEPCPTITANVRQDSQVTVPINFTGKTFHLQKRNGTRWENFALCLGSRCHKTSSAVAGVRLRDGKLELSKASAGTYRAQGSLDNACLAHIILHGAGSSRPAHPKIHRCFPLSPGGLSWPSCSPHVCARVSACVLARGSNRARGERVFANPFPCVFGFSSDRPRRKRVFPRTPRSVFACSSDRGGTKRVFPRTFPSRLRRQRPSCARGKRVFANPFPCVLARAFPRVFPLPLRPRPL
ncbi:uncharacterized protein LOC115337874 isoform X1 [Aquila chrysaetos chrysaetos]|uniref:uncharacterized protein LOC115337874 isoform X1 n=1 Tax=Aquila chrysaetos chrysaetos TaxID=223781 RepID=UPI001176F061|nr:uncharacterized protein LOC115337874 isoform X1 [Aquila chrysaetos chrysaetos]